MSTFSHTAANGFSGGHGPTGKPVTGPLALGKTGSVTSITMTALPDTSDIVEICDGHQVIAQFEFFHSDSSKLNVAQSIAKAYRDPKGLILKVWSEGGQTGAYSLTYV